jgi:acetoin utilization deacetylase AcuC-like enzyme
LEFNCHFHPEVAGVAIMCLPLQGRVVAVHEGGYSEQYVPFCGLAVIEQLAGLRTKVRDCRCIGFSMRPSLFQQQQQQP